MRTLRVTMAQLPVYAGDLEGNRSRILSAAEDAAADKADILLTPEMYLTGYPVDDLLGDADFLDSMRNELTNLSVLLPPDLLVAVGTAMWIKDLPDEVQASVLGEDPLDAEPRGVVNALVLFQHGREVGYVIKHLLPTYGVFDDARWFAAGPPSSPLVTVNGTRVGFAICEDVWADEVVDALAADGADIVLVANASPFSEGKQERREDIIRRHAIRTARPFVYVNMVGGQDEVVYDGGSFAMDKHGEVETRFPVFVSQAIPVDVPVSVGGVEWDNRPLYSHPPLADIADDTERVYTALMVGLRDYVTRAGVEGVIVGLSGGLDSALAATIAVDALGPDRVYGLAMPGPYSSQHSVDDAIQLAHNLALTRFEILGITDTFNIERRTLGVLLEGPGQQVATENIQARLRALHLMTLANTHNLMTLNTGNKSEASVGYFTLGGDSSGGFAILKDVYKTRAYELARWRNGFAEPGEQVPPIPANTISKPPSAELAPDQQDTDSLPPYPVLDEILRLHLEDREPAVVIAQRISEQWPHLADANVVVGRVLRMVARSEHKRRQVAPGVKITERAYGRDRRYPIVNGYVR